MSERDPPWSEIPTRAELQAEIERLRSERDMARTYSGDLLSQNTELLAVVERLRAALREIADKPGWQNRPGRIARAVLEGKK